MTSLSLGQLFKSASSWFASNYDKFDNQEKLLLYGLYKQATEGDIPMNPFLLFISMNPKERAWGANKGIMTEEAKHRYIEHIDSRNLGWSKATASAGEYGTIEGGMGLCPSTLSRGNETPSTPFEIYYEAIRMGDMKIIANFVNTDPVLAATRDSTGGSAMHWAADAGRHELIPILKDAGFQVNDIDNEHQTPLHLAAICEHVFTVKELLENGAYPYYKDDDGMTAMELIMESPLLASLPRFVGHSFNEKTVLTSW